MSCMHANNIVLHLEMGHGFLGASCIALNQKTPTYIHHAWSMCALGWMTDRYQMHMLLIATIIEF